MSVEPRTHRVEVLLDRGSGGTERVELVRSAPLLAVAVVCGIRDIELSGAKVVQVMRAEQRPEVLAAADLILRLRAVILQLSEEEAAVLLELLPV